MSRPLRIQYPGAYYHVTCRGNEQREIFRNPDDRKGFLRLLSRSLNTFEVQLLAYALMPNHFHLLVCTPQGNLSEFMRHFNISYTAAFNRKYHRSGHLYQGRYKAFLIDEDNYLLAVSRYIHLNPLRMKSQKPVGERWQDLIMDESTSFPGYLRLKDRKAFVHYKIILDYFGGESRKSFNDYKKFVAEGIEQDLPNPLEKGRGTGIVGSDDFIDDIKEAFRGNKGDKRSSREQPALRELEKQIKPDDLIEQYAQLIKINREELTRKGKQSPQRAMLMEMLYRICHITQPEIGKLLGGIDYSAVSQARKRLQIKIENDPDLAKKAVQIQNALVKCQD
jgi:putative transposase